MTSLVDEFGTFSHDQLIEELALCEREIGRWQLRQLRVLSALDSEPVPAAGKQFVREEVATLLRSSPASVRSQFELADGLQRLPSVVEALHDGRITVAHARAVTESMLGLDDACCEQLANSVLPYAETHDVYDTRRKVSRELAKIDPFTEEQRLEMGLQRRRVWSKPADVVGMSFVGAELPSAGAAELMRALAYMAEQADTDDGRTKDQRAADALVQLGRDVLAGGCAHCRPRARPVGVAVHVTVALSTLLGLDEQQGEVNGEPAPASYARALATSEDATWRRIVTDELGHLLDYGRTTYRPPAALRDFVAARDRTCRFPGCHRGAELCELDHVTPWEHGGTTSADNLIALCSRHHHLKHEATGWQVKLLPGERGVGGAVEWTSPAGRTHFVPQATYPLDATGSVVVANDNAEGQAKQTRQNSLSSRSAITTTDPMPG